MSQLHIQYLHLADQISRLGYIIKEEGISICMSSKHLQTRRLLSTLQAYLLEIRALLIQVWKEANDRATESFMDHTGVLRDARTGKPIESTDGEDDKEEEEMSESGESCSVVYGMLTWC